MRPVQLPGTFLPCEVFEVDTKEAVSSAQRASDIQLSPAKRGNSNMPNSKSMETQGITKSLEIP